MHIAIIHNINSVNVTNHIGAQNREKYLRKEINAVVKALQNRYLVRDFDGDKYLIRNLESFFPAVHFKKLPDGIALNLAYGIQGNSRYTHVPSILEMAGIPYTGSGPLAQSIALDKEMTKRILSQSGIPTPRFVLVSKKMTYAEASHLKLSYPLIIKPENEAASFGISVVDRPEELVRAVAITLNEFHQPLLVEEFLNGREFNVGVLGNGNELEVFEPVEIDFSVSGHCYQSHEGKKNGSYKHICPADIPSSLKNELKKIAVQTFIVLKCNDYARIDFRMDSNSRPYVLELNSMAAIHAKGSFYLAAKNSGYSYSGMLDQVIKVARKRYEAAMEI